MLEQSKFGDFTDHYAETAAFGGQPENQVPRALPADDSKPNALLPPPTTAAAQPAPKKGFFGKFKGLFQKSKPE